MLPKPDPDDGSIFQGRIGCDRMSQIAADPAAQVEADPACLFIAPSIISGISLFENTGNILRRDPDPRIPDTQNRAVFLCVRLIFHLDRDPPGFRVFQRIGDHLLQNELEPFFVRHCFGM